MFLVCFLIMYASASITQIQEIDNLDCGASTREIFLRLLQEYFKDKTAIVSLQFGEIDQNEPSSSSHPDCLLTTVSDFVMIYYRIDVNYTMLEKQFGNLNEVFHDKRYGFLLASKKSDSLEIVLETLSFMDHDKRIILLLSDNSNDNENNNNASDALVNIWKKHRMLDIIGVQQIRKSAVTSELLVGYYDPFRNNLDGIIIDTLLSSSNYRYETSRIPMEMRKRLLDVQGYPLRVCIFEIEGLVTAIKDSNGKAIAYEDMHADTVSLLSRTSNFTQIYVQTPPGTMFGSKDANGTSTGLIWVMENELADIAANLILIQDYGLENATFLHSSDDIVFEFMTPRRGYATKFAFLSIFEREVSLLIFLSHALVFIVWIYMKQLKHSLDNNNAHMRLKDMKIGETAFALFGSLILIAQPTIKLSHERFLIGGLLCLTMVLSYVYQGAMVRLLSTGHESLDIVTLEELLASDLEILLPASFKPKPYVILEDNYHDEVLKKGSYVTDIDKSVDRVVLRHDAAFLMDDVVLDAYRHKYYVEETGQDVVHKVAESFKVGSGGFMVAKRCPFAGRLNEVLKRMTEAGLILNRKEAVYWKMDLSHFRRENYVEDNAKSSFTFAEFGVLFKTLAITWGMWVVVFLAEVMIGRRRN